MADPYAANVSLLVPMFGPNGGATFTDYSPSPKTFTANGNAVTSTAQYRYYWASGYFDGTGDYVDTPDSADFTLGAGDFTVEFWIRPTLDSQTRVIFSQDKNEYSYSFMSVGAVIYHTNKLYPMLHVGSTHYGPVYGNAGTGITLTSNVWTHIAIVRNGTTVTYYKNGAAASSFSVGTGSVYDSAFKFTFGRRGEAPIEYYRGYLQDFRFTKSVARYTTDFTVPEPVYGTWTSDLPKLASSPTLKTVVVPIGTRSTNLSNTLSVYPFVVSTLTTLNLAARMGVSTPLILGALAAAIEQQIEVGESIALTSEQALARTATFLASADVATSTDDVADGKAIWLSCTVIDTLTCTSPLTASVSFNALVTESLTLQSAVKNFIDLLTSDTLAVDAAMSEWLNKVLAAREIISLLAQPSQSTSITSLVAEVLAIQTVTEIAWHLESTDLVDVADTVEQLRTVLTALIDDTAIAAAATPTLSFVTVSSDDIAMADSAAGFLDILASSTDTVRFLGALTTPEASYSAWVMNLRTRAPYQYSPYAFNSFGALGTTHYGLKADGLYALTGDTDAGDAIEAHIKTGLMDFGTQYQKNITRAYLGYRSDGSLYLRVTDTEDGDKREVTYALTETHGSTSEARIKLGQGVRARYWQFELSNVDGSDFNVDALDVLPIILKRRV